MTRSTSNLAEGLDTSPPSFDPTDPYLREGQIFPVLTDEQIARIKIYGTCEDHAEGASLFERGDRGVDFFVVLKGSVEIFDFNDDGSPRVFTVHRQNQFTGELDLFNNRKILVGGRTGEPSTLLRLSRSEFNRMSSTEQDIGEIIMRAFILRRSGFIAHDQAGVTLVGENGDSHLLRLQRFLRRNGYPYRTLSPDSPDAQALCDERSCEIMELPFVAAPGQTNLSNPSTRELADAVGLTEELENGHVFDLAIMGAGPAGLSACVYAASESLDTLVIESEAPGGQAGTSSKIENYLGFPTGISGQALAGRAWIQGQKFGAQFAIARSASEIQKTATAFAITLDDGEIVRARSVIIATGASYRRLSLDNYSKYEGQGIHYAATAIEAQLCGGQEVVVVGGGNSAGQAAVFLSNHASHVHVLVRRSGLGETMSDYLVQRIEQSNRITLHPYSEISGLGGERILETVSWTNRRTSEVTDKHIGNVFVMIGAVPNTRWLKGCVDLDDNGFVLTGVRASPDNADSPFSTSSPGIFAVGDVRSGSVKRVASGVGEGSVCVSSVHAYLARGGEP
ncbi:MAG: FAD-dependent oxidoreductase [Myxococcota bacterium]